MCVVILSFWIYICVVIWHVYGKLVHVLSLFDDIGILTLASLNNSPVGEKKQHKQIRATKSYKVLLNLGHQQNSLF